MTSAVAQEAKQNCDDILHTKAVQRYGSTASEDDKVDKVSTCRFALRIDVDSHSGSRSGFKIRTARRATETPVRSLCLDRESSSLEPCYRG